MATTKKRNKAYRPGAKSGLGGLALLGRRAGQKQPLPAERQSNVVIAYHQSIEAMIGGFAEAYHFDTIVYALNIGVILAERGLGAEYLDLIAPAIDGMARAKQRYLQTGKFGLDGDALRDVRAVSGLHEAQIAIATAAELEAAIMEMHRRVEAGECRRAT